MDGGISLIQDLAVVLLAAGIAGALCKRAGLSVVVGYLMAGIAVGPYTPPFSYIQDVERIQTLSQVGLVFLMFAIGLGLSISRLRRMGAGTFVATIFGAFFMFYLTRLLGQFVGWTPTQSLFVAAMFMVSSSAVIAKIIHELKLSHERSAQQALAITVMEDVVAISMLTILATQTPDGSNGSSDLGGLLGGLTAFVVLLVGAGLFLVPRLVRRLEKRADPELQTIMVAGLLFILALAAAKAGYSLALGAFLLGAMVAEIPQKASVENAFAGVRDIFSSVFFVSIGMMIDVRLVAQAWPWILGLTVFAVVGRSFSTGLALILTGNPPAYARQASLLLTPLGEFSFIIAQTGIAAGVLGQEYYPIAVGVSVLTVLITPLINRYNVQIVDWMERVEPARLKKTLTAYHGWLQQLQNRPAPPLAWKLIRGRLVQILVEMLFISGMLIFSRPLYRATGSLLTDGIAQHPFFAYGFWGLLAVMVLIPLVAVWRNSSAIAMIIAESLGGGSVSPKLIETGVRTAAALLLIAWMYPLLPESGVTDWGWLVIAIAAVVIGAVFSNRLIYWHSQWQSSVRDVLATPADGEARAEERLASRQTLSRNLGQWDIHLEECAIPENSAHAGQTLGHLAVPRRFGASVVEVERNDLTIPTPGPDFAIYCGDRLLLMGRDDQLKAVARFFSQLTERNGSEDLGESILDTCAITDSPRAGQSLGELQITRHTGVRVVGIERDAQRITSPSASDVLQNGDRVLVLGSLAQVTSFRKWLKGTAPVTAPTPPASATVRA